MLVPLQTLPGWPAVSDPPALEVLGLLLGLPLAVVVVFSIIGKVSSLRAAAGTDTPVEVDEPLWLGGPRGAAQPVTPGQRAALPAAAPAAGTDPVEASEPVEVGGASVRW